MRVSLDRSGLLSLINIRPQVLLAVLTFCYATGRFSSRQIEQQLLEDPFLRYLTVNVPVDQLTLRTFRRRWRQLIKQGLVTLFHSAWQQHYGPEPTGTSPSLPPHCDEAAAVTIIAPLKEIVCEAEDRVVRAIFCDMVEAEE